MHRVLGHVYTLPQRENWKETGAPTSVRQGSGNFFFLQQKRVSPLVCEVLAAAMHLVDYTEYVARSVQEIKAVYAQKNVVSRAELALAKTTSKTVPDGFARMEAVDDFLESLIGDGQPVQRSNSQKLFHTHFLNAALPHIYGWELFERFRDMILRKHEMEEVKSEVFIITPRRFGKTWSVSMMAAALLFCVPGMWISTFSTGQRASSSLLEQVAKWVKGVPGGDKRIIRINSEQIYISGDSKSDVRRFYSYPSNPKTLRGTGAKIVILEEAAQVNIQVFTEVIIPLLGVRNTSILGISTPEGSNNFYSQLIDKRDEFGNRRFKTIELTLVCEACRADGWLERNTSECPHNRSLSPPWKSSARTELVQDLMSNTPELFQREHLGMITDLTTQAFPNELVDRFLETSFTEYQLSQRDHDVVFVAIDPCGGGESSMAICSGLFTHTNTLLVRPFPSPSISLVRTHSSAARSSARPASSPASAGRSAVGSRSRGRTARRAPSRRIPSAPCPPQPKRPQTAAGA